MDEILPAERSTEPPTAVHGAPNGGDVVLQGEGRGSWRRGREASLSAAGGEWRAVGPPRAAVGGVERRCSRGCRPQRTWRQRWEALAWPTEFPAAGPLCSKAGVGDPGGTTARPPCRQSSWQREVSGGRQDLQGRRWAAWRSGAIEAAGRGPLGGRGVVRGRGRRAVCARTGRRRRR